MRALRKKSGGCGNPSRSQLVNFLTTLWRAAYHPYRTVSRAGNEEIILVVVFVQEPG